MKSSGKMVPVKLFAKKWSFSDDSRLILMFPMVTGFMISNLLIEINSFRIFLQPRYISTASHGNCSLVNVEGLLFGCYLDKFNKLDKNTSV